MVIIHRFLSEDDVEYYRKMTDEEIKERTIYSFQSEEEYDEEYARLFWGIPEGNIDDLLKLFREKDFTQYCRKTKWAHDFTKVLNNDGSIKKLPTRTAEFIYKNKWNQEGYCTKYRVIVNEDMKILWVGLYDDDKYFVSYKEQVYQLRYTHKFLYLYPKINIDNDFFDDENLDANDCIIKKYKKNIGVWTGGTIDNVQKIFLEHNTGASIYIDEHFKKGFFYKGLRWNRNWQDYRYPDDVSILTNIFVKDDLFHIEIENMTYPLLGYLMLNLKDLKIVGTKILAPMENQDST